MSTSTRRAGGMLLFSLLLLPKIVRADCECGYTANVNSSNITAPATWLFTDVLESDFFHIDDIHLDTDWYAQNFSMTPEAALGPLGLSIPHLQAHTRFSELVLVHHLKNLADRT
jgi:hypothetical protein